ncbi:hypothetical protein KIN20_026008 [Parelaphostrongylus tenuis]|uniref:Uncharacterized protein n=1 Tax=Parelaphostrongylus tenuis TaxID=148309 RepID=A0AAD5QUU1_PARTN|nr:hypothetical protein KIN20_026008 [Parelaphostrongylus tenuis]
MASPMAPIRNPDILVIMIVMELEVKMTIVMMMNLTAMLAATRMVILVAIILEVMEVV